MSAEKMSLIDACEKAVEIIVQASEMEKLYNRAVRCVGEGPLRMCVMDMAADAIQDKCLCEEVFAGEDRLLTFFCGLWIQYLLVDIAGVKKERLGSLVRDALKCGSAPNVLH